MRNLSVGNDVYIGPNTVFLLSDPVVIEDEVLVAHKIMLTTTNHTPIDGSFRRGAGKPEALKFGVPREHLQRSNLHEDEDCCADEDGHYFPVPGHYLIRNE